ncbi:MAG: SDR family NAD(P)-dependent oxidoreductase [Acidothermus sp.]|nr:SDR family NAD(P)-dependent oxidoreductase [Acidothermus sp.]
MRLSDARVLVTGAGGGIGQAIVSLVRLRGGRVVASCRSCHGLQSLGDQADRVIVADLSNPNEIRRLAAEAEPIDVLVNNAGAGWYGPTAHMSAGDLRRLVAVNLEAPLLLTRLLLPAMLERGRGHVVFISSVAGHLGVPQEAVYSATKAGLLAFAEALRSEVHSQGIGVSVVSPGAVATDFFRRRGAGYQRRWPPQVTPTTVARAVVRAIERDIDEVFVPSWLRIPALLHGGLPTLYRSLAARFG